MALSEYFKEKGEIVVGSQDSPIGFCKVMVPKYLEGADIPFVEIMGRVGNSRNEGSADQVNPGDMVWVEFQKTEGVLRPLVVGSAHQTPDGLPNYPHDSFDGPLTLNKRHLIPRDEDGNVHEDFEEPKRYVKGRAIAIVKEGISYVTQAGQLIITSLRSLSHLMLLDSGNSDLFAKKNLFVRAKNNLHLWGNKISIKGKTVELSIDDIVMELNKFGVDAKQIILESGGIAKVIAGAIQLVATGDFIISSQGTISQDANGSALTKVNQNLLVEQTRAWGAQLMASGVPIAEMGIEATLGKIIAENLQGSIKGQIDETLDAISTLIDEISDAIIKTGTGDGVISPATKSKLLQQKPKIATIKATNSLIMK